MRRVTYLPAALADLKEIIVHIADDNPDRAAGFVDEVRDKAAQTGARPGSFTIGDDLAPGLRVARQGRYLIHFRVAIGRVEIVRVLHGVRDLRGALDE